MKLLKGYKFDEMEGKSAATKNQILIFSLVKGSVTWNLFQTKNTMPSWEEIKEQVHDLV